MRKYNSDMENAMQLAIHHYCSMLDPAKHNIPYFFVKLGADESYAYHSEWDFGDATGRYLDSLISCRLMTGCSDGKESEEQIKDALRWMFAKGDGLSYRMESNEWVQFGANMFDQRSVLLGLLSWYMESGDKEPYEYIKGIIKGLLKICVEREDFLCFPFQDYIPGMEIPEEIFNEHGFVVDPAHYGGGVLILPLAVFYEKTGDPEAEYMIKKLINFIVNHSRMFNDDGSFWSRARYPDDGHFHSKMGTIAGIIRYAVLKGDIRLLEWCDKVYCWARSMGGSIGWFPEGTGLNFKEPVKKEYEWISGVVKHSEICCTTDMIHCALYLSKCGFRNYWDHAEAYANYLLAAQIRDVSWAKEVVEKEDTDSISYRDIPNRYRGAFTGRSQPNDLTNAGEISTMACCCAAGGRGLYLLWSNAVEHSNGKTAVNLFINSNNNYMQVRVGMPEEGFVEMEIKVETELAVRIPYWLEPGCMSVLKNGKEVCCNAVDGYLVIGKVSPKDLVIIEFPLNKRIIPESIARDEYRVAWKGNRVIGTDPKGKYMPLFNYNEL